ncbi:SH3 domain-containing protein [Ramlibacter sp. H39-3-26]|uniref:SH3 domain-containing protein n=1 Tax=Curvibacter soli TaxID=3031331 RepID=UPI0023D99C5F|nr:SH3 domain-containing protein [Ramlibacter sp. H39-3-26]MDF1483616.1 SH3 domain-containing protein [Ramlibacter sp. H39-3-26]
MKQWHGKTLALCLAGWAWAMVAQAQNSDAVVAKRAVELRETPGDTARSLGALPAQTPLTRAGERQGAWVQVRTAQGATGWVHMFDLGAQGGSAAAASGADAGGNALRGLASLFGGGSRSTTTTATSTVGIRGLGAEDIANAQPNLDAVDQAEKLRLSARQAQQFAAQAPLASHKVDSLPEPRPAAPAGGQHDNEYRQ